MVTSDMKLSTGISTPVARRATYLRLVKRRIRPGTGSSLQLLRSRGACPMPSINQLLQGARFVVGGDVATSLYMAPRFTKDIDILVYEEELPKVESLLVRSGASSLHKLSMPGNLGLHGTTWRLSDGSELDVVTSKGEWAKEAVESPNRDGAGVPIVSLPYLVLLKLDASRLLDMSDLGRMLGDVDAKTLKTVKDVVAKYFPEAADDVDSIAELGRLEYSAAKKAQRGSRIGAPPNNHIKKEKYSYESIHGEAELFMSTGDGDLLHE